MIIQLKKIKAVRLNGETRKKILARKKEFGKKLLAWQQSNSSHYLWRKTNDPYHILIAEMLLRKTRADQVSRIYERFMLQFPTLEALSRATPREIEEIIKTLGISSRGKWIYDVSRNLSINFSNIIPSSEQDLRLAIGNGKRYTINAIRCFAFGENIAVFDVNVMRVIERVFSLDLGEDAHKRDVSWEIGNLLVPCGQAREYNWGMLDLGRLVCISKNPRCEICPLRRVCDYALTRRKKQQPSSQAPF